LFSSSSHQIPLVPIKVQSNSFCSHQLPLIPINNLSISFCSHQVPKQFPSSPHQNHFVPMTIEYRQVSAKLNGGQSAEVRGQARRGATVAGRRRPGAAEQKFGIFCLPGSLEDRGQNLFSRGSLQRFLLHVRDPRDTWIFDK
jgi:hypothetical protein